MRIVIETDEGERPSVQAERSAEGEIGAATTPSEVAAQAATLGASSAGPAPAEMAAEEPPPFVSEPGTPETTPEDARAAAGLSAGAAPEFAVGAVEVEEVEAEEGGEAEG